MELIVENLGFSMRVELWLKPCGRDQSCFVIMVRPSQLRHAHLTVPYNPARCPYACPISLEQWANGEEQCTYKANVRKLR